MLLEGLGLPRAKDLGSDLLFMPKLGPKDLGEQYDASELRYLEQNRSLLRQRLNKLRVLKTKAVGQKVLCAKSW